MLFEFHGRLGIVPHARQLLSQFQQLLFLLGANRGGRLGERLHPLFQLRHALQGAVPARLQFAGHQAILRVGQVILPPGSLRLVASPLQGQLQRAALFLIRRRADFTGLERRLDPSRSDRGQHLLDHHLIHLEPAHGKARARTPFLAPALTQITAHVSVAATVADVELAPAAPTAQQPAQQGGSPLDGS
jgi:hypothetical protein